MTNAPWFEIGNALQLALLRRGNRAVLGSTALIVAVIAHVTLEAWLSWNALFAPREFYWPHAIVILGGFALLWLSAWLAAGALGRPALSWTLAGYSALALFPLRLGLSLALTEPPETVLDWGFSLLEPAALNPVARHASLWLLLGAVYGLFVLRQLVRWLHGDGSSRRRWIAVACLSGGLLIGFDASRFSTFWYPPWDAETASNFDAEAVMYAQPELLHRALKALAPQTPGKQDVYVLAFGGDGAENVFRNEVELATERFNQVFASGGRTLALINHPDRILTTPLASRTNLSIALQWLGRWMDPTEDLLILFMTSHGSEDPSIHVAMDPLPLNPITPDDLQQMLDESGIRWKIAIISACYSGGFLPSLQSPESLIITASRADRTSFGCGSDADYTYFGRAFLQDAFGQFRDWPSTFAAAQESILRRERAEGLEASEPQFSLGAAIKSRLPSPQAKP